MKQPRKTQRERERERDKAGMGGIHTPLLLHVLAHELGAQSVVFVNAYRHLSPSLVDCST